MVESFNGHFRANHLHQYWLAPLEKARQIIATWREDGHTERTHPALKKQTPATVFSAWEPSKVAGDKSLA